VKWGKTRTLISTPTRVEHRFGNISNSKALPASLVVTRNGNAQQSTRSRMIGNLAVDKIDGRGTRY